MRARTLQIDWGSLPEQERKSALHLEKQLGQLTSFAEEFRQALILFDENLPDPSEDFDKLEQGYCRMRMAAHFAVLNVYHFRATLNSVRHLIGSCPTLKPKVDSKSVQELCENYDDFFPNLIQVRDGVSHYADKIFSSGKIQENAGEFGFIHGVLFERSYQFTHKGKYVSLEISQRSLEKLLHYISAIHSAFSKIIRQAC